jgi:signal transduction histidine kinase
MNIITLQTVFAYLALVTFSAVTLRQFQLMYRRWHYRHRYSRAYRLLLILAALVTGYFALAYVYIVIHPTNLAFAPVYIRPLIWLLGLAVWGAVELLDRYAQAREEVRQAQAEMIRLRETVTADYQHVTEQIITLVGHELRTPLTGIKAYLEMFLDGAFGLLTNEQLDAMQASREFAQRLHLLAERVIATARPLDMTVFNLTTWIQEIVNGGDIWINTRLKRGDAEIVFDRLDPLLMHADPTKVSLVVMELITNALKFSNGKGKRVEITAEESGSHVVIAVKDYGQGIGADDLQRLGKRFQMLYKGQDHRYLGLGLGLPMVHELVEAHGGRVEVASVVGEGSMFRVYFPRQ